MTTIVARERSEKIERVAMRHLEDLSSEEQHRVGVIQRLESHRGQFTYREAEREAAAALNFSVRNIKRLVCRYREQGVEGLKRPTRCDEGESKVDESWREFI